jgi:hypothetical protein
MLSLLKEQYWWPNMRKPVEEFLLTCTTCSDWRPSKAIAPPMPIVPQTRTERVMFDYAFVKLPDGRERWMLWGETFRQANGKNTEAFIKKTFSSGQFSVWQCDNGRHLKNKRVKAAIKELGRSMANSAPYYPKCNGQIECPGGQEASIWSCLSVLSTSTTTATTRSWG